MSGEVVVFVDMTAFTLHIMYFHINPYMNIITNKQSNVKYDMHT